MSTRQEENYPTFLTENNVDEVVNYLFDEEYAAEEGITRDLLRDFVVALFQSAYEGSKEQFEKRGHTQPFSIPVAMINSKLLGAICWREVEMKHHLDAYKKKLLKKLNEQGEIKA
jgi:hypothetical protein